MITADHVNLMARYNAWQNLSIYRSAAALSDEQRTRDLGAFFGSVHSTLAHILWADRVWMSRFANTPSVPPEHDQGKSDAYSYWEQLAKDRHAFDDVILSWSQSVSDEWLAADFTWSNIAKTRTTAMIAWKPVTHFFNHQTHHRGQVHCMLTGLGITPEDTDLFLMPGI